MRKRTMTVTDKRTSTAAPSLNDIKIREKIIKTSKAEGSVHKRKSAYETRESHLEKDFKAKSSKDTIKDTTKDKE